MIPSLPQDDPKHAQKRQQELEEARKVYRYNHERLPPIGLAEEVPEDDEPGPGWTAQAAELMLGLLVNSAKVDHLEERADRNHSEHSALYELIKAGKTGGAKGIFNEITMLVERGRTTGRPKYFRDYGYLFQEWRVPEVALDYRDDLAFARMRLAGPNPMWLQGISTVPEHFPVTEEHYREAMGDTGDTLAAAAAEGRLFLSDYACLAGAECGTFPNGQKYVEPAMGLFAVPPAGARSRDLRPVAIQCGQTPGPETPIFTPLDGHGWLLAKTVLTVADGNCHQAISHLAHTHMATQPFVMAMHRQLPQEHPLRHLLEPHFEGTLSINDSAESTLLAPGGGVDMVMAGTIETSRAVAGKFAGDYDFDANALPQDLANRKVADTDALPDYPYRDDGLLIWKAIETWVDAYVRIYYTSDQAVQEDTELQAWAAEICSHDGGRVKGFAREGRIPTVAYLIEVVTGVIYTASAKHASVNFPQLSLMDYVPNFPLAGYRKPPTGNRLSDLDYLDMLPCMEAAQMQFSLGRLLGGNQYTTLGQYPHKLLVFDYFRDGRVSDPLKGFHAGLESIESTIRTRNHQRLPYPFLIPSRIPNSLNI